MAKAKSSSKQSSCAVTKAVQKGVKGGFMPKGSVKTQSVKMNNKGR